MINVFILLKFYLFEISYISHLNIFFLEAEEEEKRRRIAARVNANIGKKENPKSPPPAQKQKTTRTDDIKFKIHDNHKSKKPVDKGTLDSNKDLRKATKAKHKVQTGKNKDLDSKLKNNVNQKSDSLKSDKHKNEHRKEKERTVVNKNNKVKRNKPTQSNNGLNFNDLMKFAKLNSENPGSGAVQKQKEELKKKSEPKTGTADPFDPDRNFKIKKPIDPGRNNKKPYEADQKKISSNGDRHRTNDKRFESDRHLNMKRKHEEIRGGPPSKQSKPLENRNLHTSKQKNFSKGQPLQKVASKDIARCDITERPQHGLVVETVSYSKSNGNKDRMKSMPHNKNGCKVVRGVGQQLGVQQGSAYKRGGGGGIEAQFRSGNSSKKSDAMKKSNKKKAEDYEDEFEKEEKMLARKRRLFELRRTTGMSIYTLYFCFYLSYIFYFF